MLYRGNDGKYYEDTNDLVAANNRWNQQEKQNELLQEQNQLLAEQAREQERLVREQIDSAREIEKSRQKHEKDMRILSLCDEIGISHKTIEDYIDYVLSSKGLKKEDQLEYDRINKELDKADKEIEKYESKNEEETTELSIWQELKVLNKTNLNRIDDEEIHQLFDEHARYFKTTMILFGVGFAFFLFLITLTGDDESLNLLLILIGATPMVIAMIRLFKYVGMGKGIAEKCDQKIEELTTMPKDSDEDPKLARLEKKRNQLVDKRIFYLEKSINQKLNDFYKFRQNHYNAKFEKFLIDYDFESKLHRFADFFKIEYQTVTKSKAKSNGDIDDYVDYFTNVIK